MSHSKLLEHIAICVAAKAYFRKREPVRAESISLAGLEGDIIYCASNVEVHWNIKPDGQLWSCFLFHDESGTVDPEWVRSVCRSVEWSPVAD